MVERADLRVMPRGDVIATALAGMCQERSELHMSVAVDAGVGCPPCLIRAHELFYHVLFEGRAHVDDLVGKTQAVGDGGGVIGVRAASARPRRGVAVQQHGCAEAFVPLPLE